SDLPTIDQQVVVGRCHIDPAALDRLAIPRLVGGEWPGAIEDHGQHARALGWDVQHDEYGRRQVGRQLTGKGHQRLDPPGRRPNYDDVMSWQKGPHNPGGRAFAPAAWPYRSGSSISRTGKLALLPNPSGLARAASPAAISQTRRVWHHQD